MSPRRKRRNPETPTTTRVPEPEATAPPGEPPLPANIEYVPDELHWKLVPALKKKANDMFNEAIQDPDSQANELVRILLLNQVANMDAASYQNDPRLTVTEERHRGIEFQRRAEYDKHMVKMLEKREKKLEEEIKVVRARGEELQQKLQEGQYRLAEAERLAQNARAAAEHGAPLDPVSVYTRIAEIIGLQSPAQPGADTGAPTN